MCCCQLGISGWCGVLVGFRSYRRSEKKWDFDWHKSAIHGIFTRRIPSKTLFLVNARSWIPISPSWKDQIRVPLNHISVVPCFFMEQIEDVLPEKSQYLGYALRSVEMWQPRKSTAPWQLWDRCTHFIRTPPLPLFAGKHDAWLKCRMRLSQCCMCYKASTKITTSVTCAKGSS